MINEENKFTLIDRYIQGEMTMEEVKKFEEVLNKDATLKEEVDLYLVLKADYHIEKKHHFDNLIFTEELNPKKVLINKSSRQKALLLKPIFRIAALLTLGIGMTFFAYKYLHFANSTQELAQTYLLERYPEPPIKRGQSDMLLTQAQNAYKSQTYNEAIQGFQKIEQNGDANAEHYFYLGLSYLYKTNSQPQKAIMYFNKSIQSNPKQFEEEINWFKALAYLKDQNKEEAKVIFKKIISNDSWKKTEAQKLIEMIQ